MIKSFKITKITLISTLTNLCNHCLHSADLYFILIMLNYLEKYGVQKGYSVRELHSTKCKESKKDYPSRFTSYEEYIDALHDYLNGA